MATDKKRLLDVWILEADTVYREVPFAVVADWLQQGRLLAEDKVRLAGAGKNWHPLANVPAFVPYVPKPEPLAVEDKTEALEPVDLGFEPTKRVEEDDEDVDMIPLIDISLVLLIFFMMTASVSSGFLSPINTPGAKHQLASPAEGSFWIGIDTKSTGGQIEKGPDGKSLPWFSFGKESTEMYQPTTSSQEALTALGMTLESEAGEINIRLRADRALPIETIKGITLELHGLEDQLNRQRDATRKLKFVITGEVSEPQD